MADVTTSLRQRPKRLTDSQPLRGQLEYLALQDMRAAPGDIINQVQMGKVYVITKQGKPVAVLQALPGERLSIEIDGQGKATYGI